MDAFFASVEQLDNPELRGFEFERESMFNSVLDGSR